MSSIVSTIVKVVREAEKVIKAVTVVKKKTKKK